MNNMFVVGKTSNQFVYIYSPNKQFILDEYLKIKDSTNNNPIGKVVETYNIGSIHDLGELYNTVLYIRSIEKTSEENIYIAKLKIETELNKPIKVYSKLIMPTFDEIKHMLIKTNPDKGLSLGVVLGSKEMYDFIPSNLQGLTPIIKDNKLDEEAGVPFIFDILSFYQYPHLGLFGGSGSGKTYAFNVIFEELILKEIPTIIFDPHYEMDFSKPNTLIDSSYHKNFNNVSTFQIGKNVGIPFSDLSTMEFISLLEFVGNMSQPMISSMLAIHEKGDTFTLLKNKLDVLIKILDLQERRELTKYNVTEDEMIIYNKYESQISGLSTLKALQWRVLSIERENIFNNNINALEADLKRRKTIIVRGSNKHLNMLASYMVSKFYFKRRRYVDRDNNYDIEKFPPFIIGLDEAHIFAPKNDSLSPTKSILKTIAQEGRKYGVYQILATQRPGLLDDTIIAQLSTKMIFRTTISEDINMISKETNLSDNEVNRLPYLSSGNAFISSAIIANTVSVRFRVNFTEGKVELHPFDELSDFTPNIREDDIIKALPINISTDLDNEEKLEIINQNVIEKKDLITSDMLLDILEDLYQKNIIDKQNTPFGWVYDKK